jgi:hypothetical protein
MTRIDGRNGRRIGWVVVLAFGLGAGIVSGMRSGDEGQQQRDVARRAQLAAMGSVLKSYGAADSSALTDFLAANPTEEVNAELMIIPLSLGNVYLNAFELRRSASDLERSIQQFEFVAGQDVSWTGRHGSGAVIAYLQISLARVDRECDVGDLAGRIADVKVRVDQITLSEAQSRSVTALPSSEDPSEDDANDAALFAAAANFLPDGPDRAGWLERSRTLASRALSGCPSPVTLLIASQGALSFQITGSGVPDEFGKVPPLKIQVRESKSCPSVAWWLVSTSTETSEQIGQRLSSALMNSRTVAVALTEHFLWSYSGGCFDGEPLAGHSGM